MGMLQSVYDWLNGLKTPTWLKGILSEIQDIIISAFLQIGKDYIKGLTDQIIYSEGQGWTNEVKLKYVYSWGVDNIPNIKEATLRMAIEILVNLAKKNSFVKIT